MYGNLKTKELKKTHSSRPVGGVEMCSWAERTYGKMEAGGPSEVAGCGARQSRLQLASKEQLVDPTRRWLVDPEVPHLHTDEPGGTKREQNRPCNPGFQHREIKPQATD